MYPREDNSLQSVLRLICIKDVVLLSQHVNRMWETYLCRLQFFPGVVDLQKFFVVRDLGYGPDIAVEKANCLVWRQFVGGITQLRHVCTRQKKYSIKCADSVTPMLIVKIFRDNGVWMVYTLVGCQNVGTLRAYLLFDKPQVCAACWKVFCIRKDFSQHKCLGAVPIGAKLKFGCAFDCVSRKNERGKQYKNGIPSESNQLAPVMHI